MKRKHYKVADTGRQKEGKGWRQEQRARPYACNLGPVSLFGSDHFSQIFILAEIPSALLHSSQCPNTVYPHTHPALQVTEHIFLDAFQIKYTPLWHFGKHSIPNDWEGKELLGRAQRRLLNEDR